MIASPLSDTSEFEHARSGQKLTADAQAARHSQHPRHWLHPLRRCRDFPRSGHVWFAAPRVPFWLPDPTRTVLNAVKSATGYVHAALQSSDSLSVGQGFGALNHGHNTIPRTLPLCVISHAVALGLTRLLDQAATVLAPSPTT